MTRAVPRGPLPGCHGISLNVAMSGMRYWSLSAIRVKPSIDDPSNHVPWRTEPSNWWMGMVTALTAPMMSVNWSWMKRMPELWACSIFSMPSTASLVIVTDLDLLGWARRFVHLARAPPGGTGCLRLYQPSRGARAGLARWFLFFLHKSHGHRQRQPQVRVGEAPAGQPLDPAQPVGDGVAVDAQLGGGLGDAGLIEHGAERVEMLAPDVGARGEERLEEGPGEASPVGQVVQVAQEADGGQPVGPRDGRWRDELLRRLERGAGIRLARRAGTGIVERPRDGDRATQERPDPTSQHRPVRVAVVERQHGPQLEALGIAPKRHPARRGEPTELATHGLTRVGRVVRVAGALPRHDHDPRRSPLRQRLRAAGRV